MAVETLLRTCNARVLTPELLKIYVGKLRCVLPEVSVDHSAVIFLEMYLRTFLDVTMHVVR